MGLRVWGLGFGVLGFDLRAEGRRTNNPLNEIWYLVLQGDS